MLSFLAPTLKIYPDKDRSFGREAIYGTAIKLYDYKYLGERSNVIRGRSILSRLDLSLPEIALPIRLYEFRKSESGIAGNANGLSHDLDPGDATDRYAAPRQKPAQILGGIVTRALPGVIAREQGAGQAEAAIAKPAKPAPRGQHGRYHRSDRRGRRVHQAIP